MNNAVKIKETESNNNSDDISIKNVILKVKEYYKVVLQSWKLLALFAVPFVIYLTYKAVTTPTVYPARMTFMVNEDSGSGGGSMGGFLSQIVGGSGGGGGYNVIKVIELSKSREITKRALFIKDTTQANSDFLINEIIEEYDLRDEWKKNNPKLADFKFTHSNDKKFNREENGALKKIHSMLAGNENNPGIIRLEVNSETNIFKMVINALTESLSIRLLDAYYKSLSEFYISETVEKPKITYENLQNRTDSVRKVMLNLEYKLASTIDSGRGLISRKAELTRNRLEREVRTTTLEYGKLIENLGAAEFSLENATPVFQVIDPAINPISPVKESIIKSIIIGCAIGFFLGIIFVLLRKVYQDVLAE